MMRKIAGFISSWWLTAHLVLLLGGLYVFFSFGKNPYPQWKAFVFSSSAGLAIYAGLIINLAAATVRVVVHRLNHPALSAETVRRMDSHAEMPLSVNDAIALISAWIKRKGFNAVLTESGIRAVRGKYSFLPGTAFRLGLIIVLTSLLFSAHLRRVETKVVHESEEAAFFGKSVTLASVHPDLPDDFLQVGEDSTLMLERVSARITSGGETFTVTSRSPERINGLYYRIVHLVYSQPAAVKGIGKPFVRPIDLDVLPPGKTHVVSLPSAEEFLTFTLEPERTITKGIFKGKQYNLQKPSYRVIVQKGKEQNKTRGFVVRQKGQDASGRISLALGESSSSVAIQAVRDPALFWVHLGVLLTLGGLISMLGRFFWFEKRFSAVVEGKTILAGYSEEYYKKWGVATFQDWKEELATLKRP